MGARELLLLEFYGLRANFADLGFNLERNCQCSRMEKLVNVLLYNSYLCEKTILEAFLNVAPKAVRFLVGLRKTSLAASS